jgi:hypothetical protein
LLKGLVAIVIGLAIVFIELLGWFLLTFGPHSIPGGIAFLFYYPANILANLLPAPLDFGHPESQRYSSTGHSVEVFAIQFLLILGIVGGIIGFRRYLLQRIGHSRRVQGD